jgi:hypothetical protein
MPCCGGQPGAYFVREVPDGRQHGVRPEHPGEVADVAEAAGRVEADRAVWSGETSEAGADLVEHYLGGPSADQEVTAAGA